ncbi:MAG: lysine--tRNA ligase [Blastocatellia bacterium]|nr:lysine--tRNA ligase [Blastocatellia bacterium]
MEQDHEQTLQRKKNLQDIIELGFPAYTHSYDKTHTITEVVNLYSGKTKDELAEAHIEVCVPGRIRAVRKMGKAAFITYSDGQEILQVYLRSNEVGEKLWKLFELLDLGDLIGVKGHLFRTKTDEFSIHATDLMFLAKALIPPPDKYYGLHDKEVRYRQRYADLIANRDVRDVFVKRSQIIREIRSYFDKNAYVEVETPMLSPLATGAAARPFVTHHNALDITLYARIAPELYLKRLIVGGLDRVYEINRNFRNEGLSIKHNPEFTMLEFYQAYSDYKDLIELTEELITDLVAKVCGTLEIEYNEKKLNFARPWTRLTMREAVIKYWPENLSPITESDLVGIDNLRSLIEKTGADAHPKANAGQLLGALFEHLAEPHLQSPTFITRFPTELSPLSKQSADDPNFVDRFELFIAGMEVANAFSELNDPIEQRNRFEAQMKQREGGDEEAMVLDEDYIRALSYGMPPTAGEGIGIDRLVMILTGQHSIRDVILFPHMRPERKAAEQETEETEETQQTQE